MDFRALRDEFPITRRRPRCVHLNHAGMAPLCRPVMGAMTTLLEDQGENGALRFRAWLDDIEETRRLAARLIGADDGEIAFVLNTTDGMSIAASGLPWRPGDNAVVYQKGYPAAVRPFLALARRGVEIRRVDDDGSGRIFPDAVLARCDGRTRAVGLSLVEYATGFRLDVEALGPLLAERGIRFVVDAIQGLGVTPLDVRRAQIDALASGGFKWLLGPMGSGFLFVRREVLPEIEIRSAGAGSVERPFDFDDLDQPLSSSARRFEGGTWNLAGIVGLRAALELLLDGVGVEAARDRIFSLVDRAAEALRSRGYEIRTPLASRSERSGILAFTHPAHAAREIERRAAANGVAMATRGGFARISPHAWNDESDIDAFLEAVP